jgi:hypothetical protein
MREERDEERVAERIPLGAQRVAVDVDQVRDPFERVEADPDRQHDPVDERVQPRKLLARDDVDEVERVPADELGVLEVAEQRQHAEDPEAEDEPPPVPETLVLESSSPPVNEISVEAAISAGNHHSAYA